MLSASLDTLIGTVDFADLGRLVDSTANPNVTSYTYKISAVDSCGHEGPKSAIHQSIHLQSIYSPAPQKMDLSWNLYVGAPVDNYRVMRDTNNSGNWIVLANNLAPNATSFTDYGIPAGANSVQYRVDVVWLNTCDPTAKVAQSIINTTKSNTKDFVIGTPTSLSKQTDLLNSVSLFPNPTKDYFEIKLNSGVENLNIKILNQLGSIVKTIPAGATDHVSVNINDLSSGVYYIVVKTPFGSVTKRLSKM